MMTPIRRRQFLSGSALQVGTVALAAMLQRESMASPPKPELQPRSFDTKPKTPPEEPRAKAMISLWMQGGPSHHDLFDPKPEMAKYDGKPFPGEIKYDNAAQASSKVFATPWKFAPRGQCGMELSELLPHTATIADDICLIRSMHTGVNNHNQSIKALQMGRALDGRPTLGSWLTYGLGTEADNLPAFVALPDPASLPVEGVVNWQAGFLPSIYQGTVVRSKEPRILNLTPPEHLAGDVQRRSLEFLSELNQRHLEQRPGYLDLEARIASYELAAKMQIAASDALDLTQESRSTKRLYGITDGTDTVSKQKNDYGARCLIARRLIERGVRFVQVYTHYQAWDSHGAILKNLPASCRKTDQASAALVKDLKWRGLLDSTVVHWGGEMGRLPVIQNDAGRKNIGRDHNTYGFSSWVAGGGFRAGHVHGATDQWGHKAVEDVVHHYDYHATLLHLFGLRHDQLIYKWSGRDQSLTDSQGGRVIEELLA